MDGNNRWVKANGKSGISGHRVGVERVRDVLQGCIDAGVEIVTVYAFSSENWQRPAAEVTGLMGLFKLYLEREAKDLAKKNVALRVIGARDKFSASLCKAIDSAEAIASEGKYQLNIAADYGGRWDITNAARSIAQEVKAGRIDVEDIDESVFNSFCQASDCPPPDLLIRTGGDQRISNFLLWQCAYSELYFTDTYWPDFGQEELTKAIEAFQMRQRRFGKTAEQVSSEKGDK
jgi:undecaprenyl diphosphate synthase